MTDRKWPWLLLFSTEKLQSSPFPAHHLIVGSCCFHLLVFKNRKSPREPQRPEGEQLWVSEAWERKKRQNGMRNCMGIFFFKNQLKTFMVQRTFPGCQDFSPIANVGSYFSKGHETAKINFCVCPLSHSGFPPLWEYSRFSARLQLSFFPFLAHS